MCTLKNYPYKIEHTIQWSRDLFEGLFTQSIQTIEAYRTNPTYLEDMIAECKGSERTEAVNNLHRMLTPVCCESFEDCCRWSARLFDDMCYQEICQLTHQFPVGRGSIWVMVLTKINHHYYYYYYYFLSHLILICREILSMNMAISSGQEISSSPLLLALIVRIPFMLHLYAMPPCCWLLVSVLKVSMMSSSL